MKKIIVSFLVLLMCFSISTTVFAKDIETDFLAVDLGTRDLTPDQIKDLSEKDVNLICERSMKDVKYLLDQCEEDMNQAALKQYEQDIDKATRSTSVTLGVDKRIYSCDRGNKGSDSSLISGTNESYSSSGSKSECWTTLIGSGSSWAFCAASITVSGSGSEYAYIRFYGTYGGLTNPGFMGGSAGARVRMSVYDVTAGTEIDGNAVLDVTDSMDTISTYSGDTDTSIGVYLQGGHTYLLRYGIATSVSNYSPQMCQSCFYDDTNGVIMDYIKVDFI